jgi:hypothetical protein
MNHLIDMLQKSAEADKSKALLTLEQVISIKMQKKQLLY